MLVETREQTFVLIWDLSHLFKIQQGLSLNSLAVSEPQRASSCCLVWGWGWRGLSAGECLLPSHNHTTQFTRTCSSSPRGPNTSISQHTHCYTLTVDSEMEPRFPGLYSDFFFLNVSQLLYFLSRPWISLQRHRAPVPWGRQQTSVSEHRSDSTPTAFWNHVWQAVS